MSNVELNLESMKEIIEALRNPKSKLKIGKETIKMASLIRLGGGGTKTVYQIDIDGEKRALALPNSLDASGRALEKWEIALKEPQNTQTIRDCGFLTNPVCEKTEIEINFQPFFALLMLPYSELPFKIGDSKNPGDSTIEGEIPEPDSQEFQQAALPLISDVCELVKQKIILGRDSINIAQTDDGWRLFLNDLGNMKIDEEGEIEPTKLLTFYLSAAFGALLNSLPWDYWQQRSSQLNEMLDFIDPDKSEFSQWAMKVATDRLMENFN